jgi:hypothetical protein
MSAAGRILPTNPAQRMAGFSQIADHHPPRIERSFMAGRGSSHVLPLSAITGDLLGRLRGAEVRRRQLSCHSRSSQGDNARSSTAARQCRSDEALRFDQADRA